MKKLIYLAIPTLLFILNIYIGFIDYENGLRLTQSIFGEFRNIVIGEDLYSRIRIMIIIFLRNLSVAGLIIITGPFYAIPTVIISSFNGYIVGAVAHSSILSRGVIKTLALLLPHGIVEVPTILYAGYLSIILAVEYVRDKERFLEEYINSLKILGIKIAPLLLLAAFIEAFITPIVAGVI